MNSDLAFAALAAFLLAAPVAALAATPHERAASEQISARPVQSTVHDLAGQRFDVPPGLIRPDGMLINGLAPQPQQFD